MIGVFGRFYLIPITPVTNRNARISVQCNSALFEVSYVSSLPSTDSNRFKASSMPSFPVGDAWGFQFSQIRVTWCHFLFATTLIDEKEKKKKKRERKKVNDEETQHIRRETNANHNKTSRQLTTN